MSENSEVGQEYVSMFTVVFKHNFKKTFHSYNLKTLKSKEAEMQKLTWSKLVSCNCRSERKK